MSRSIRLGLNFYTTVWIKNGIGVDAKCPKVFDRLYYFVTTESVIINQNDLS